MKLNRWLYYAVHGQKPPIRRRTRKPNPDRNWRYRAFVRQHPCAVCLCRFNIEAAHTGEHGVSIKSSYFSCIPLCRWHHQGRRDSLHNLGPKQFQKTHRLKIGALVRELNAEWLELNERRRTA